MKKVLCTLALLASCALYAADVDVVAPANLTSKPSPIKTVTASGYPKDKKATVIAEIVIGKDGTVIDAKIRKSTDIDFEPATLEARPLLSGRDFHFLHHENPDFRFDAEERDHLVTWRPYDGGPAIHASTRTAT